jgi:hypothetical protein
MGIAAVVSLGLDDVGPMRHERKLFMSKIFSSAEFLLGSNSSGLIRVLRGFRSRVNI